MTIEDKLRDRLHTETAGIQPPNDLLLSLARGHAARYKRARLALAGGSLIATALVAVLLVGLLASPPPPQPLSAAEVLRRAKEADAAATGKIIHFRITSDAVYNVQEVWVLRSEQVGRSTRDSGSDHRIVREGVVRTPGEYESIDHLQRTVQITDTQNDDVVEVLMPPIIDDPKYWLLDDQISVVREGSETHLVAPARAVREGRSGAFDVTLDPKTYLPVRATFYDHQHLEISWLEPTPENRKLLMQTVPPGYRQVN